MAYAFVVCVQINNEELFLNAFPFENSYYFDRLRRGLDVVRSTGNLSSLYNGPIMVHHQHTKCNFLLSSYYLSQSFLFQDTSERNTYIYPQ